MNKIIFISGKYRDNSAIEIDYNIEKAKNAAIQLWQRGYIVICPHMNSAHFDGYCDELVWLNGYTEILKRCDCIYMLNNWRESEGATIEHEIAKKNGKEIIYE